MALQIRTAQLQLLRNMADRECKYIIKNPDAGKLGLALKNLRKEILDSVLRRYYGKCLRNFLKAYKSWNENIQSLVAKGCVDDRRGWRYPWFNSHILWNLDEIDYEHAQNVPKADLMTELRGNQETLIDRYLVHQPGREDILKAQLSELRDFAATSHKRRIAHISREAAGTHTSSPAHSPSSKAGTSFITQPPLATNDSKLVHFEDSPVIKFLPPAQIMHTLILEACCKQDPGFTVE